MVIVHSWRACSRAEHMGQELFERRSWLDYKYRRRCCRNSIWTVLLRPCANKPYCSSYLGSRAISPSNPNADSDYCDLPIDWAQLTFESLTWFSSIWHLKLLVALSQWDFWDFFILWIEIVKRKYILGLRDSWIDLLKWREDRKSKNCEFGIRSTVLWFNIWKL